MFKELVVELYSSTGHSSASKGWNKKLETARRLDKVDVLKQEQEMKKRTNNRIPVIEHLSCEEVSGMRRAMLS